MKKTEETTVIKKFSLFIVLCFAVTLFGENTQDALLQQIGLPLFPKEQKLTHTEFEKKFLSHGIRFNGNPAKRTAFIREKKIFGVAAKELHIISNKDGIVEQTDVIFNNKGDTERHTNGRIRSDARMLKKNLTDLFGVKSKEKFDAEGVGLKIPTWSHGDTKITLESVRKEYTILHIVYPAAAKGKSDKQVTIEDLKKNIVRNDNGDVFIKNIPMIDQGPKGYCAVATLERVLLYYGIKNVTQHQLADTANTGDGGGTSWSNLVNAAKLVTKKYDFSMISCGNVNFKSVKKYIDKGVPILWCMYNNDNYYAIVKKSRQDREACKNLKTWLKSIKRYKVSSRGGAHICLIIGYNEETEEIAVSNSWGDEEIKPGWVPLKSARKVSQGICGVLIPDK